MTSSLDHHPLALCDGGWRTLQNKQNSFDAIKVRQTVFDNATDVGEIEMQKRGDF